MIRILFERGSGGGLRRWDWGELSRVKIDQAVERAAAGGVVVGGGGEICTSAVMGCIKKKKKKIPEDFIKMMRCVRACGLERHHGGHQSRRGVQDRCHLPNSGFYALTPAIKGDGCILALLRFKPSTPSHPPGLRSATGELCRVCKYLLRLEL